MKQQTFMQDVLEGKINEKRLFEYLYPNTCKLPVKSSIRPSAQSTGLCKSSCNTDSVYNTILTALVKLRDYNSIIFYIAELQFSAGLRISEVLQIKYKDITKTGHVLIRALKGSRDRIVYSQNSCDYLLQCRVNAVDPFTMFNRYFIYRCYKKFHINFDLGHSSKSSVTHAFRHVYAMIQKNANISKKDIGRSLGHKNESSVDYYL